MNVSEIYTPPVKKRSADYVFVVKDGGKVDVHTHSTREEAETERAKIIEKGSST